MQLPNNKEQVPFAHYLARCRLLEPQEAARRCGVRFFEENQSFSVRFLGTDYRIFLPEYEFCTGEENAPALCSMPCRTFLLRFLLEGRAAVPSDRFVTFREMPWGEAYNAPYTGRCLERAARCFGTNPDAFCAACSKMGAKKLRHGDAGYEFEILPAYRMQMLVWTGDEEFPPSSQILYTDNFADAFSAEDRVVAAELLICAIRENL